MVEHLKQVSKAKIIIPHNLRKHKLKIVFKFYLLTTILFKDRYKH